MTHDSGSPPPAEVCGYCSTRRTVAAWRRILWVAGPILLGLATTALGTAVTGLVQAAATEERVDILVEGRVETADDRRRLATAQAETDRELVRVRLEIAERLQTISLAVARIEMRLDAAAPRPARRDEP